KRYSIDRNKYISHSIHFSETNSFQNLRGRITLDYHNIEKGLTHIEDMRKGFGQSAMNDLFKALDEYVEKGYPVDDIRYVTAINVLKKYIERHKEHNFSMPDLEHKINAYPLGNIVDSGVYVINHNKFEHNSFRELLENRHSIREFGSEVIDYNKLQESILLATRAPSACNRQPCKVYLVSDIDLIKELLHLQGGLNGNGSNIQYLILITSNKSLYRWDHERNQNFIDGGIFSGTLLYSLEANNIASCPLHCDLSINVENDIKSLLSISEPEDLIHFIAVGSFPEQSVVPVSLRDRYSDFVIENF
uniref:nitroreductase family protein n=1 Tax=Streptococcus merionis TaxID=400065 RepID=UPI0026EDFAD6